MRAAAVGAVMLAQLRSDPVKIGLLRLVREGGEPAEIRAAALQALEQFPLDDREHAVYAAAYHSLEELPDPPPTPPLAASEPR